MRPSKSPIPPDGRKRPPSHSEGTRGYRKSLPVEGEAGALSSEKRVVPKKESGLLAGD